VGPLRRGALRTGAVLAAALLALAAAAVHPASAQLISPGKLASAHADLEGVRHCTSCHELGKRGISDAKCLACHTPLRARVRAGEGYHATVTDRGCASCHKDHLGPGAELVRFDTDAFDHALTGYRLEGKHRGVKCRDCHRPEFVEDTSVRSFKGRHGTLDSTYLGLGTTCVDCHRADDPHRGQFAGRACSSCHATSGWKEAPGFDHADTRYPLTGKHAVVACGKCHRSARDASGSWVRYTGLAFTSCTSCHADPHEGAMGGTCTECHSTAGWKRVDLSAMESDFDHATTGFRLEGRHARLSCASCHAPGAPPDTAIRMRWRPADRARPYPPPLSDRCSSCHVDYHRGAFEARGDSGDCEACHGQDAWSPSTFDLFRHDRETDYRLQGAHRAVPCAGCHRNPDLGQDSLTFHFASVTCRSCHDRTDDPHHGQFGDRGCESCHTDTSFRTADRFDHAKTDFPLTGAHRDVPCASCHRKERLPDGSTMIRYRPLGTECSDCHASRGVRR